MVRVDESELCQNAQNRDLTRASNYLSEPAELRDFSERLGMTRTANRTVHPWVITRRGDDVG